MEFQRSYADVVLELSKLNKDLNDYLTGVHQFCQEVGYFDFQFVFSALDVLVCQCPQTGLPTAAVSL